MTKKDKLSPGKVNLEHFRLLIDISGIHKENIIYALELYFVKGFTRQETCKISDVSLSSLSIKIRYIQTISHIVVEMYPWYEKQLGTGGSICKE